MIDPVALFKFGFLFGAVTAIAVVALVHGLIQYSKKA